MCTARAYVLVEDNEPVLCGTLSLQKKKKSKCFLKAVHVGENLVAQITRGEMEDVLAKERNACGSHIYSLMNSLHTRFQGQSCLQGFLDF
jgi:hypothetical protein